MPLHMQKEHSRYIDYSFDENRTPRELECELIRYGC